MSEVEKEVSVEKEKLNKPAEVKKEEEKPVAAELPSEPQVEDKNNEDAEKVSEKKKKKKKKSKKKFAGRSGRASLPPGSILPELRCIGGYVDWYVRSGQTADLQTPVCSSYCVVDLTRSWMRSTERTTLLAASTITWRPIRASGSPSRPCFRESILF